MEKCPFCEQQVPNFKDGSHIVPKWLHRLSFGKQSRTYNIDTNENKMAIAQDGEKGSYWCEDCEKKFAKDEQFASFIFQNRKSKNGPNVNTATIKHCQSNQGKIRVIHLQQLDFKKFQKFVLSVLLREHMALAAKGKDLLGDKHFKKMKSVYFDDNELDDSIYPMFVNKINPANIASDAVMHPFYGKGTMGNLQTFMAGGFEFHVRVQSHGDVRDAGFRLKSDGSLIIPIIFDSPSLQNALAVARKMKSEKEKSGQPTSNDAKNERN